MTIRARLTVWYAVFLTGSALLLAAFSYHEFIEEKEAAEAAPSTPIPFGHSFDRIIQISFAWGGIALVLGLAGGWWLTRKALLPIATLTDAATKLHEGNLHGQLPVRGNGDELDRLTEVFNAMTARLDQSFQRVREFTLHASHELKTPLTVMRGELESALRDESLPGIQRERVLSQLDEVARLTQIVDGLTLLTKADAGQVQLESKPVRLDELVHDAFADAQILARPWRVNVTLGACPATTIQGDRHRLRQMLLNLTDNAVKYNRAEGTVGIDLRQENSRAILTVANSGPGIPREIQERVFDRFFRGDSAHSHTVEGCGLGLSISRWIARAHGGEISLVSEPSLQTVVTVQLPLGGEGT
ncbi:MAG TPA: HAMP domain-containing sensor histidine kinase [Verrucomicrobiae bacterium]|nr:HAMP domain-containing sensor histidine kinase [Verrucomicrobiae bacterium]